MNYESRISPESTDMPEAGRKRRTGPIVLAGLIIAALLIGLIIWSQGGKKVDTGASAAANTPTVSVIAARDVAIPRIVTATGTIAARQEMPVSAVGEGGRVTHVLVQPGDWVKAGQVLVTIERSVQVAQDAASAASISAAEANARIAQSNYERAQALVSRGFISKADVESKQATRDAALAQVTVARAQMAQSRALTGRLDVRAPASGLVLSRSVEEGQVVGPASGVLFRIARDGAMEMKAQLAEADLAQLHKGAVAQVTPTGSTRALTGSVWQVAPIIDPQTRQGVGRIALAYDASLRPGGFASAQLDLGTIVAPLLPQSAVQTLSGDGKDMSYVYIIDGNDKVVRRNITIASVSDQGIAIGSGLTGTERVVETAAPFLNEGQKVHPVLASPAAS